MKVALFVPNMMRCFNCDKFGQTNQCCKVAVKCQWCGKDKHEGRCEGPKLCSNCDPMPHRLEEGGGGGGDQCIHVEKCISLPETRQ